MGCGAGLGLSGAGAELMSADSLTKTYKVPKVILFMFFMRKMYSGDKNRREFKTGIDGHPTFVITTFADRKHDETAKSPVFLFVKCDFEF